MRRIVLAAVVCFAAASAAPADEVDWFEAAFATKWAVSTGQDPVTDATVTAAYVLTTKINRVYSTRSFARVQLLCDGGKPLIRTDWTFPAGGKANLTVEYRFAGLPGRRLNVRYVNKNRQETTDSADISQFLADAAGSDELYVRVDSDLYGPSEAVFPAKAGATMVRIFLDYCPDAAGGR